ncbi:HAD hydrolase family protein [Secundilactobacillus kimchicus]|uniref:Cof-like hydrolase n=1 Tax=Secundilactobacillus kimchicus JCM 15530 TaxID=1302272 RepID=A0A0R1HLJ2_9LACO|nr:HAD hydrolase family protein [Secundilactobacillus kimchicus]KRK47424.1 Cof-like hydrolase [Secundilactobacillus kimchicus JCM 15530]
MIKMVVVDMDGTFLRDDRTYDTSQFDRLFKQMKAQQIRFVAASGSQFQRLQKKFPAYIDDMDFISQNGAIVHRGQTLQRIFRLEDGVLHDLIGRIQAAYDPEMIGQLLIAGLNGSYISNQTDPQVIEMLKHYYRPVFLVDHFETLSSQTVQDQFTKLALSFYPGTDFQEMAAKLAPILPPELAAENSGFNTEMIGLKVANKRTGIATLQTAYDIRDDEVVTFGDNENDLPMLAMTPHSYAMQNASALIQQSAHHVTTSDNNHDGVLETLSQLIG